MYYFSPWFWFTILIGIIAMFFFIVGYVFRWIRKNEGYDEQMPDMEDVE